MNGYNKILLFMNKKVMKLFFKTGYMQKGKLFPAIHVTPLSSLYANLTFDGLERIIQDRYHRNSKENNRRSLSSSIL